MSYKTFDKVKGNDRLYLMEPSSAMPKSMVVKEVFISQGKNDMVIHLFRLKGKAMKIVSSDDKVPILAIQVMKHITSTFIPWKTGDNTLAIPVPFFTTKEELKSWLKITKKKKH